MTTAPDSDRQCAAAVMMIRPASFGANPETAASNRFQQAGSAEVAPLAAQREFDGLVAELAKAGVEVHVTDDNPAPVKPDACFPNNWVSFHDDGSVVLYPMLATSRRAERRDEAIVALQNAGYRITRRIDLTGWEARGEFLEGTGSLVLDRRHRIAYACWSPRTTPAALADFAARLGYRVVSFDAHGPGGQAIYHTNVMMAIGERFAVLCADTIPDPEQRAALLRELEQSGREPIIIGVAEMNGFAGNLLALNSADGRPLIAMSAAAWNCLAPRERRALERHGTIVTAPIPTIERLGGGSVRCMIAEVFLPR